MLFTLEILKMKKALMDSKHLNNQENVFLCKKVSNHTLHNSNIVIKHLSIRDGRRDIPKIAMRY